MTTAEALQEFVPESAEISELAWPKNLEAEEHLLSAVLTEPDCVIEALQQNHPGVCEYFFNLPNRQILAELTRSVLEGTPIEIFELQSAPEVQDRIRELRDKSVDPSLAEKYAAVLRDLYIRRRKMEAGLKLEHAARCGDDIAMVEAEQILSSLRNDSPSLSIEDRRFDPNLNPPAIRPVYAVGGVTVATPGNIQTVAAQLKSGKSGLMNAFLASSFATAGSDTLTVSSVNPDNFAVLHFDTEQSIEDHWHQVRRAIRRAGRKSLPPWVLSFCLTGFDAKRARAAIWARVKLAARQFGGIHSILIDGVADLVCNINDPEECNEFVAALHALAIEHDCAILCVIHFNPGTDVKARGHLGSQLQRKAETNLQIDKDGEEISSVWSDKQRRAPILRGKGPRYKWSTEASMHLSLEPGMSAREQEELEEAKSLRDDVFLSRPSMRRCDLEEQVQNVTKKSSRTAKRIVTRWGHLGIIEKSFGGLWTPTT